MKDNINLMLGSVGKGLDLEFEVVGHDHINIGLDGLGYFEGSKQAMGYKGKLKVDGPCLGKSPLCLWRVKNQFWNSFGFFRLNSFNI